MNTKRPMGSRLTLTDLPDIAIDEILIRLPIKDAVRTSVLSRGWRRRWHSIPALDLWGDLPASQILPTDVISQILLQHSGTIRVLRAKLDAGCPIYCWLSTLSRRAASTLRSLTLHYDGVLYINSVGRYFPNLTHLHLSCVLAISPDRFSGIPSLRTLHLEHFCTKPSVLISKFPLLETLIVKDMDLMTDGANENIVQESGFHIVAPNLRRLELLNVDHDHFTITSAPLLETLIISHCNDDDGFHVNSSLMEVLGGAPRIKRLEVDDWIFGAWARDLIDAFGGKIPMRIPIVMEHLRVMSLNVLFDRKKQIALTLCLLRSTPNLQELNIRGCSYHADEDMDVMSEGSNSNIVQEYAFDIVAPNLCWLELLDVDFDHFTITSAPLLETLIISLYNYNGFHRNSSLMDVLAGAPRIKRLEVDHWILGVWARNLTDSFGGKIPMRIPIVTEHLRVMSLEVLFDRKKQITLALCLLRSTPNLQELEIRGCSYHADEDIWGKYGGEKDFWEAQEDADVFERLGRVKMTNIEGIKSELYFIRFVLAKAHTLKTMMVTFCPFIKTMEWLFTKLLGFPRASNQARILLTDDSEADDLEDGG